MSLINNDSIQAQLNETFSKCILIETVYKRKIIPKNL